MRLAAAAQNGGMKNLMHKMLAALERGAQRMREREIAGYLSQATDVADLENRLRRIERATLRRQLVQIAE